MKYCKKFVFVSGLILSISPIAHAQDTLNIDGEFQKCMLVNDAPLRFSCYEDLAEKLRQSLSALDNDNTSSTATATQAPVLSSEQSSSVDSFGKPEDVAAIPVAAEEVQALENYDGSEPRMAMREDGKEELQDRIAELSFRSSQIWEITLEGGQVWRQTIAKRYNLKEGGLVKVYQSRWGKSFRLEMEGRGGFIQVKRIK